MVTHYKQLIRIYWMNELYIESSWAKRTRVATKNSLQYYVSYIWYILKIFSPNIEICLLPYTCITNISNLIAFVLFPWAITHRFMNLAVTVSVGILAQPLETTLASWHKVPFKKKTPPLLLSISTRCAPSLSPPSLSPTSLYPPFSSPNK